MIKNSSNADISNAIVIVTLDIGDDAADEDDLSIAAFEPASIPSRVTATVNEKIFVGDAEDRSASQTASAEKDSYHRLTIGQKYLVEVRADIVGGEQCSQVKVISPQ